MSKKSKKPGFEEIVERLEEIAQELERGEPTLEESLRLFEEGMKLSRVGSEQLDTAEARLEQLMENGELAPMDEQPSDEAVAD